MSAQQKLQKGRSLLSKAANEPDLLPLAMTSIHGALEDACRSWLSAPNIYSQHGIDVNNKHQASWKTLLDLASQYCGWSQQDVKYVSRMNYLRNQAAHGDGFKGTYKEVENYLNFVTKAIANDDKSTSTQSSTQKSQHKSQHKSTINRAYHTANNQTYKNRTYHQTSGSSPFYRQQVKSFTRKKPSFITSWLISTFASFFFSLILVYYTAESLGLYVSSESHTDSEKAIMTFIFLSVAGFCTGFLQWKLIKNRISRSWRWIIATTIGFVSPVIPIYIVILLLKPSFYETLEVMLNDNLSLKLAYIMSVLAICGAITGYFQWLVIRQQFSRAGWWIIASAIGHSLGFYFFAGITGFALPWIFDSKKAK